MIPLSQLSEGRFIFLIRTAVGCTVVLSGDVSCASALGRQLLRWVVGGNGDGCLTCALLAGLSPHADLSGSLRAGDEDVAE